MNENNLKYENQYDIDIIGIQITKEMLIKDKEIEMEKYKNAIRNINSFILKNEKKYPNWKLIKDKKKDREMLKNMIIDLENETNEIREKCKYDNIDDFA